MLIIHLGNGDYPATAAKVVVPGIREAVGVRLETTDVPTFVQVFQRQEYAAELPFVPQFIIDGGANVGYTSIWFANRYPAAEIMAVEPEPGNFQFLRENTLVYPRIEPLHAAIWRRPGQLQLITHDSQGKFLGQWGIQVAESDRPTGQSVAAVTIDQLLERSGHAAIDILKLDVEGAETEIFAGDCGRWLSRTNVVMIEVHDWLKPGCSQSVLTAMQPQDFSQSRNGQTLIFVRKSPIGPRIHANAQR